MPSCARAFGRYWLKMCIRDSYQGGSYQSGGYQGSGSSYSGSNYQSSGRQTSGRPSVEMGAETGANEPSYRQGPSVYNTSNQEEFGDNPTAYPTGLAEE